MTSSAKIARTGFSFAHDFLPRSPSGFLISRSTDEDDLGTAFAPAAPEATNARDPLDAVTADSASALTRVEELRFVKLNDKATLPKRAHENDAGLDLHAAEAAHIPPGARVSVGTGLAVAVPEGHGGLVLPRSGLSLRHGVTVVNSPGLIDPGYRGEVRVLLLNTDGAAEFQVTPGDRIAQLLVVPVAHARPLQVDTLDSSSRGAGGFGSTGS